MKTSMKHSVCFLGLGSLGFMGCADNSQAVVPSAVDFELPTANSQPIFFGEETPTLYTSMTASEQNAVVALCLNYSDHCFCTGTMVSNHVVVTAAHCVIGYSDGAFYQQTASETEVRVGPVDSRTSALKRLKVQDIQYFTKNGKHYASSGEGQEDYNMDIAVIILKDGETSIPKIDIQKGSIEAIFGNNAQAVGFGTTYESQTYETTNTQRYWTTLKAVSYDSYGQILVNGNNETGVAPGDSGSPLLYDFGDGIRVAGVASTSAQGVEDKLWVYGANYTPVDVHEAWIRSFINKYDNATCLAACNNVGCGTVGDCSCGGCDRGYECDETVHQCVEKPAGEGGVCWDVSVLTGITCKTQDDCGADELCYYDSFNRVSYCMSQCAPSSCSQVDDSAICYPLGSAENGYMNLCLEQNNSSCTTAYASCTTTDGGTGICADLYGNGKLLCYGYCSNNEACEIAEACRPYDKCTSICLGKKCGEVSGCNCGTCRNNKVCGPTYTCIYPEEEGDAESDSSGADDQCSCDYDTACSADCSCDPECPCACDVTAGKCDKHCSCDPDCRKGAAGKGCNGAGGLPLWFLAMGLLAIKRGKK